MFNDFHAIAKRIKLRHKEDRTYFPPSKTVPKEGYRIDKNSKEKGIVFYVPLDEEYFNPAKRTLLTDPLELYKAGLIVDKVHGIKRLKEPKRWCVLPKDETVTVEVPLTEYKNSEYDREVVQEIGHVAWYKAYFHVDNRVYEENKAYVNIKQVLQKVESKRLPRWRPQHRYWNIEFIGAIEIPGTVFCTERELIKNLKYKSGDKPEIVHQKDVSHTRIDKIGCSVFRRNQPPYWIFRQQEEKEEDNIWDGLENRNQWVYSSLYSIWAGENTVEDTDYRERVYWTGPARHFDRDEYFQCNYPPHCVDIVDIEETEDPRV